MRSWTFHFLSQLPISWSVSWPSRSPETGRKLARCQGLQIWCGAPKAFVKAVNRNQGMDEYSTYNVLFCFICLCVRHDDESWEGRWGCCGAVGRGGEEKCRDAGSCVTLAEGSLNFIFVRRLAGRQAFCSDGWLDPSHFSRVTGKFTQPQLSSQSSSQHYHL